jgi:small GTP-binding protein
VEDLVDPFFEFKVLLVGDPAVGKTSLILRFVEDRFDKEYKASIGVDIMSRAINIEDKVARLVIWDIASQEKFRRFRSSFYQQANGILVVFDLTRRETLENVDGWVQEVREHTESIEMVLIGNKSDLITQRQITPDHVQKWSARYACPYIETSALTGDAVEGAFHKLTSAIAVKTPMD